MSVNLANAKFGKIFPISIRKENQKQYIHRGWTTILTVFPEDYVDSLPLHQNVV